MKRIVECPSCETKLQIFDTGKGAKQKCPRCKNDFDINPGKGDEPSDDAAVTAPEPPKDADATQKQEQPADAGKQVGGAAPADAGKDEKGAVAESAGKQVESEPQKAAAPKAAEDAKDAALKEVVDTPQPAAPVKKSVAAAKPAQTAATPSAPVHEPPIAGLSGLQFMVIVALLIVTIVLQVLNMKKNTALAANQKMIYDKVKVK